MFVIVTGLHEADAHAGQVYTDRLLEVPGEFVRRGEPAFQGTEQGNFLGYGWDLPCEAVFLAAYVERIEYCW